MSAQQTSKLKMRGRPRLNNASTTKVKNQNSEWCIANKSEADPCDCLYDHCPGCWYPCMTCGSSKCSPFCRRSRNEAEWQQQYIEWKRSL